MLKFMVYDEIFVPLQMIMRYSYGFQTVNNGTPCWEFIDFIAQEYIHFIDQEFIDLRDLEFIAAFKYVRTLQ